ncbi:MULTISPECIES: DUF2953 domain-containing protein [Cytobacillus]|uniref:DUF2953 domain-containing protein n=1 Tax=Cytobacillus stercorigallinarum TaxID=2762240 RepID=A0ABR8QJ62_9BACI|nr:DUF2953 domain-containing protein [Cytobacillus stercorigallinarum]MBD7935556.1 DUF2953 domain-containing protein [Cytobacillus stercorigallinarum]
MVWFIIIAGLIFFFFLLMFAIFFSKLSITVHFYYYDKQSHLSIKLKFWKWLKYTIDIPLMEVDPQNAEIKLKEEKTASGGETKEDSKNITAEDLLNSFKDMDELLKHVVSFYHIIRHFMSKVIVRQLRWHTVIGVGNAALTGVLTGGFWSVKGSIIGVLSHYMKLKTRPDIAISPQFQFAVAQTSFICMIQFRIGHAMLAGFKLIKFWKGGKAHFKTSQLSILSGDKPKTY